MNYAEMIAFHRDRQADLTIACFPMPRAEARELGVLSVDAEGRVLDFVEKSPDAPTMPGHPDKILASMGILRLRHRRHV